MRWNNENSRDTLVESSATLFSIEDDEILVVQNQGQSKLRYGTTSDALDGVLAPGEKEVFSESQYLKATGGRQRCGVRITTGRPPLPRSVTSTTVDSTEGQIPVVDDTGDAFVTRDLGWVNPQHYGIACNGVDDEGAAWNAFILDSTKVPAGSLVVIPGQIKTSVTCNIRGQRRYMGTLKEFSGFKAANGANLNALAAPAQWSETGAAPEYSNEPAVVEHLHFDGNRDNQASGDGHGLVTFGLRWKLRDVLSQYCLGDGVRISASRRDDAEPTATTNFECQARDLLVRYCDGEGIHVYDPTGLAGTTDGWLEDCIVQNVEGHGIRMSSGNGWALARNHTYGTYKSGIYVEGGALARLTDHYIEYWGQHPTVNGRYAAIDARLGQGKHNTIIGNVADLGSVSGMHASSDIRGFLVRANGTDTTRVKFVGNSALGLTRTSPATVGLSFLAEDVGATLEVYGGMNSSVGFDSEHAAGGTGTVNLYGISASHGIDKAAGNPGVPTYLEMRRQSTAPSSPTSGRDRLYFDSSGNFVMKDSAGDVETIEAQG